MSGQAGRRRGWRAVGVTAVGFAVGAGALGVFRTATAEPIRAPLLPAPVSAPQDEQPTWTKKSDAKETKVVPASGPLPAVSAAVPAPGAPPAVPPLPSATKPDSPALPAFSPLPPAAGTTAPPVVKPDTKPIPAPAPESKGPVDVRLLRFPTPAKGDAPTTEPAVEAIPELPPPAGLTRTPKSPPVTPPAQPEKSAPPVAAPKLAPADSNLRPKEPAPTLKADGREPAAAPAAKPAAQPVSRTGPAPATVLPLPKPEPSLAPLSGDLGFPQLSGAGSTPVVVPRGLAGAGVPAAMSTTPTGDTPMTPLRRQTVMSAVLGAALATTPVRADDPKPMPPAKSDPAQVTLESLKKEIDTLRDDIRELKAFRSTFTDIVQGKKDGTGADAGLIARLSGLETTLNKVNDRLAAMDAKLGDTPRSTTALRADTGTGPVVGNTGTIVNAAHVRIVNDYPVEMSMIVNRKSYRVGPGETRVVDVPPGSYTYELLHAGAQPVTSTIKDNETVTLRIR